MQRIIKRYANRKLYDTSQSCYITLDEIALLVKDGEDVCIIDNTTKEDLTAVTMAQILFESEKQKKRALPLSTLRTLIQSGGELLEKNITRPVATLREEAERRVTAGRDVITRTRDDAVEKVTTLHEQTQRKWGGLQKHIELGVESVVHQVSTIAGEGEGEEVDPLLSRLAAIEARLAALEAQASMPKVTSKGKKPRGKKK